VGRYVAFSALGVLVIGGAGFAVWRTNQSSAPADTPVPAPPASVATPPPVTIAAATPAPEPRPPTTVQAEPPVEEAVTIVPTLPPTTRPAPTATPAATKPTPVAATPPPTPPPTTLSPEAAKAQQTAAQVSQLLARAESLAAGQDFAGAAAAYDEVLKLEPGNAKATEGKAAAAAVAAALKKTFIGGRTIISGAKVGKSLDAGFDSEDVAVAKATRDYSGRIEFEVSPKNVKPGDSFTVRIFLTNDGKKDLKVTAATLTTAVNGSKTNNPAALSDSSLNPQERVMLAELPGTWQADTKTWSLEASVTSSRGDTFKSQLAWR
jgi:hypothetical protein